MLNIIDGPTIAAEIRMARMDKTKRTFLIVEGLNDLKALSKFIDGDLCVMVNATKKNNVIEALGLLEDDGVRGVCGVVDQDYDVLLGIVHSCDNLIVTEHHDMDLVIFETVALNRLLAEFADERKLQEFEKVKAVSIRDYILDVASHLGASRLASAKFELDIYFGDLEFDKIIDVLSLTISRELHSYLAGRSKKSEPDRLKALSVEVLKNKHPLLILCQGHDVCAILGLALRNAIGSRSPQQCYGSEIGKGLRLAFDKDIFQGTGLYKDLLGWEATNKPWRVFAAA